MAKNSIPNWKVRCQVCGSKPTVDNTKLCGPCCFGEADMVDWWEDGDGGVSSDDYENQQLNERSADE